MKKLLIISLILNTLFFGYGIRKLYVKYKNESVAQMAVQPDSVEYNIARDKVFEILLSDSGEVIMLGNSLTQNLNGMKY